MKAIGGYFEWEQLQQGIEWHTGALRLNSGRNALEYILRTKNFSSIFLPDYCCDALVKKAAQLNISVVRYEIDHKMEIASLPQPPDDKSLFLFVNYFGLKEGYIAGLKEVIPNLVVDNVQAFFAGKTPGTASFNSARKFFGVPDGAYLYPFDDVDIDLEEDDSSARTGHLFDRLEKSPEEGYEKYLANEKKMETLPLRKMSALTRDILGSINYDGIISRRRQNYMFLDERIGHRNGFASALPDGAVPMAYPFLTVQKGLREKMISQRIFIPVLWPELSTGVSGNSQANKFAEWLLPLPIDHRLDLNDMERIAKQIP